MSTVCVEVDHSNDIGISKSSLKCTCRAISNATPMHTVSDLPPFIQQYQNKGLNKTYAHETA
jgi:hypothetical protein